MDLRILIEAQEGASYADQLNAALLAEELGFGGFFRTDHYLPLGLGPSQRVREPSDAWITLAGLARETQKIRIGTLVSAVSFRPPGPFAVAVAQVNEMSGGRLDLGIGAGWFEKEHRAFGLDFLDVRTRVDRLEEQLEILELFWSTPSEETFSFTGGHIQLVDVPGIGGGAHPKPPIILGGHGKPRGLRMAVRYAAEFNLDFPRPGVPSRVHGDLVAACQAGGRDPATLVFSAAHLACVGNTEEEMVRRAERAGLDLSLKLGGLIGTVEQVREELRELESHGITRFYLQLPDMRDEDHLRTLARLL